MRPLDGVPARCIPPEWEPPRREPRQTIDLSLLRQVPPTAYRVDSGDVLGVYIEGILGRHEDVPPVTFPVDREQANALGYPIPVRDDGTISLPLVAPISVRGYTLAEVETAIRDAYTRRERLLREGQDRILVSLQKPRIYHVLVIRQEGTAQYDVSRIPPVASVGTQKRGVGMVVALPAYQNDVLHALAHTGGLPGIDAENAVYILRRGRAAFTPFPAHAEGGPHPGAPDPYPSPLPHGAAPVFPPPVPPASPLLPSQLPGTRSFDVPPGSIEPAGYSYQSRPPLRDDGPQTLGPPGPGDIQRALHWRNPMERFTFRGQSPDAPGSGRYSAAPRALQSPVGHSAYQSGGRYGAMPFQVQQASWPSPFAPSPPYGHGGSGRYGQLSPVYEGAIHSPRPPASTPQTGPDMGLFTAPIYGPPAGAITATVPIPYVYDDATIHGQGVIRIPLSLAPGEVPQFTPQDVILQDGDVLLIETRKDEYFYTGGLLGGGKYSLPQDRDLDVLEAILLAESDPIRTLPTRAIGSVSVLNQDVTVGASEVVVLRHLPDGGQAQIKVNLYDAMRDPQERIIIQPGDYVFLQYTRLESVFAFIERQLLEGAVVGYATSQLYGN